MGKGNRNSQKRAEEKIINSEKNLERQKKQNNKKVGDKAITIVLAVVALIVVASICLTLINDSGIIIRNQSAMSTSNEKVSTAMMSFFYNKYLMEWYNENALYITYGIYDLDLSASLHNQIYKGYDSFDGTWYQYFLKQVSSEIEMYLNYAEGAHAAGLTLDDEDMAEVDAYVKNIKETLDANGATYSDWYGKGVKEKDIRKCYELIVLASKFRDYKLEQLEAAIKADEIPTYVEENKNLFYTADVLSYTISEDSKSSGSDEKFNEAKAKAKEEAEKIAAAKTPEEFAALVEAYKATKATSVSKTPTVEEQIDALKSTVNYNVPAEDETETADELNNWLFVENAAVNSTLVVEKEDQKTEAVTDSKKDEETTEAAEGESESESMPEQIRIIDTYTVTVYMVYETPHLDKSLTKDVAFAIADDKATLESFVEKYKNGEKGVDQFVDLAETFASDMHAGHDHEAEDFVEPMFIYDGGERIPDGYFNTSYQALNDWLDSGELVDGTTSDIIEVKVDDKTTYYAVIYFEKYNLEVWEASAISYILNEQFEAWEETQKASNPVVVNEKVVMDLPVVVFTSTSDGHNH